jgi:hypothetical protein
MAENAMSTRKKTRTRVERFRMMLDIEIEGELGIYPVLGGPRGIAGKATY